MSDGSSRKLTNGRKPSWLTYITAFSLVLIVLLNITKITDRIFIKGAGSALLAQDVKENKTSIKTNETDIKAMIDTLAKHETQIQVVVTRVNHLANAVQAQTEEQKTTNQLLLELIQKIPDE